MKGILHQKQVLKITLNKLFISVVLIVLINGAFDNLHAQCQIQNSVTGFNSINSNLWTQSFVAPCDGRLNSITVEVIDQTFTTLRIFSGSGCNLTSLYTQNISCSAGINTIVLTELTINLVNNNSYSFQLESASSSATLKHGKLNTYNNGSLFTGSLCSSSLSDLDFTISLDWILPTELLDFKVAPSVKSNLLTWQTAQELNNKGFQVERSPQPSKGAFENWEILDFVAPKSLKGASQVYEFTDNAPLSTNYYRLRQIDNDGKETLSKVIAVTNKGSNRLRVYPSVTNHFLTIDMDATDDIQIVNLLGQQVINQKLGRFQTSLTSIDVSALPQGTYILKVGNEQTKFVKQ